MTLGLCLRSQSGPTSENKFLYVVSTSRRHVRRSKQVYPKCFSQPYAEKVLSKSQL